MRGNNSKGFSGETLKLIAIAAMLIDHIAWAFVPIDSMLGQSMHLIGRITGPTMCYFIAEGYAHTHNVRRYVLRLGAFAVLSYLPFIFFETGALPTKDSFLSLNVIYTLLLGLLALWAWDKMKNRALCVLVIAAIFVLSVPGDWSVFGIMFILAFGMHRGDFRRQARWYGVVCVLLLAFFITPFLIVYPYRNSVDFAGQFETFGGFWNVLFYQMFFQLGVFLALPILHAYNGKRGKAIGGKWLFYVFYPAHLLIIGLIKLWIMP